MEEWNGTFEMVDPAAVVVDPRYQRQEKESLIRRIAQNPRWDMFGCLSLYRRNGILVCVDGQQRLRGILASEKPPRKVPAVIQPKAPLEMEAATFVGINVNRTAVGSLDKHRGYLVAKDPVALGIERAMETVGFTLGGSTRNTNARDVTAVQSVYVIYQTLGEEGLVQVLTQIRDAWPNDPAGTSTNILRGVCDLLVDLGTEYNRGKVTAALSKTTPTLIMHKAKELQFDHGGSRQKNVRRALKTLCKI